MRRFSELNDAQNKTLCALAEISDWMGDVVIRQLGGNCASAHALVRKGFAEIFVSEKEGEYPRTFFRIKPEIIEVSGLLH